MAVIHTSLKTAYCVLSAASATTLPLRAYRVWLGGTYTVQHTVRNGPYDTIISFSVYLAIHYHDTYCTPSNREHTSVQRRYVGPKVGKKLDVTHVCRTWHAACIRLIHYLLFNAPDATWWAVMRTVPQWNGQPPLQQNCSSEAQ